MTTNPPLSFASASLRLSPPPRFSYIHAPIHSSTHRSFPISRIRMSGVSALPDKKPAPKKTRKKISPSPSSEAEDLVRSIMRNFTDKQPLVNTLNKYVKLVQTEHCFLLFEELGRSERWLQCLEVSSLLLSLSLRLLCCTLSILSPYLRVVTCFYCFHIELDSV